MRLTWRRSAFRSLRDIGLFLFSARSDARLSRLRRQVGDNRTAFERLYDEAPHNDPWASGDPRFQYQKRKYDALMEMIPPRHYRRALDLGCGIGLFTERLAQRCDEVVGIDISNSALQYAIRRMHALENVRMQQGDVLALDPELNGAFDLVVIADTIYYLPTPLHDLTLHRLVHGLRGLLAANGILMVVNHYFPLPNASSRLTRRIHAAFESSRDLSMLAEHKRAFYLTGVFANTPRATLDVRATACAGPY